MTGETVVYRNEMNLVPFRNFTSVELDSQVQKSTYFLHYATNLKSKTHVN